LLRSEVGHQVHYQANVQSPIFGELTGLLRKTAGVADVLSEALAPLGDAVSLAFVYGSVAAGAESARSDIDLMRLGIAGLAEAVIALSDAQSSLGREVNPPPMSVAEFARRLNEEQGFAASVAASQKIWIKGGADDFAKLVEHRKAQGARGKRA